MPLNNAELDIIEATVPILRENGATVTATFYHNLLEDAPSLKNVFNLTHQRTGRQPAALAHALLLYASNIRDPSKLGSFVELVCQKHASLGVQKEQYGVVGQYLLAAFRQILGEAFTPEVETAWLHAYQDLAGLMVDREQALYDEAPADWQGFRPLRIAEKVRESADVVSLYLEADQRDALPKFQPGQYVSVRVQMDQTSGLLQARQYSLSMASNGRQYRISPKAVSFHEDSSESAAVSRILHHDKQVGDTIEVSFPRGEFVLSTKELGQGDPVWLISAGIGITPMMSMLGDDSLSDRPVHFIHVTRDAEHHIFRKEVAAAISQRSQSRATFFYTHEQAEQTKHSNDLPPAEQNQRVCTLSGRPHFGRAQKDSAGSHVPLPDGNTTTFYICGPEKFMVDVKQQLVDSGIADSRIRNEAFTVSTS